MHQATRLQFERIVDEFVRWREIPEEERSPAPAWWWGPALEALGLQHRLPAEWRTGLGLPDGATCADGAAIFQITCRPGLAAVDRRVPAQDEISGGNLKQPINAPPAGRHVAVATAGTIRGYDRRPRPDAGPHTLHCTQKLVSPELISPGTCGAGICPGSLPSRDRFETMRPATRSKTRLPSGRRRGPPCRSSRPTVSRG